MSDAVHMATVAAATHRARAGAFFELLKPRIAALVLAATAIGFLLGARTVDPQPSWGLLIVSLLGTGLVAGGANALNMLFEAGHDAQMDRTANRPIPSGRLSEEDVLVFGALIAAIGLVLLAGIGLLASLLAGITFLSYLLVYTPLKRVSPTSVYVGALPGATPPLIGWAAATGAVSWDGVFLFLIVFFWQMPHVAAIARLHREDYARGGFRFLPVVDATGRDTRRHVLAHTGLLLAASLLPVLTGARGPAYLVGAVLLGAYFAGSCLRFAGRQDRVEARRCLLASVVYLPLLFLLFGIDAVLHG